MLFLSHPQEWLRITPAKPLSGIKIGEHWLKMKLYIQIRTHADLHRTAEWSFLIEMFLAKWVWLHRTKVCHMISPLAAAAAAAAFLCFLSLFTDENGTVFGTVLSVFPYYWYLQKVTKWPKEAKLTPSSHHLQALLYSVPLSHLGDQSNSWGDFFNKDECQIILMRFHIQHLL